MALRKVELERVKKGSGQSTYIVASRNLGTSSLADFLRAADIPYNKIYYGGGKVYVKIPSTAQRITGVYGAPPTYYDELGQGVSMDPALAESQPVTIMDEAGLPMSADPGRVPFTYRTGTQIVASMSPQERTQAYVAGAVGPTDAAIGREVYDISSPLEQVGLHAHTLLSPKGWEYGASYVTSFAFPGQRTPQDIVYETTGAMGRITTEEQRQQYVLSSALFNPPAEILYAYAGGLVLGTATAAVPKLGQVAASGLGKGAAVALTGAYVAETGMRVSGKLGENDITGAGGELLKSGASLGAMVGGFKAGQKYGGEILLRRTDPGLGRAADIAKSLEGTRSEWVRSPESIKISQLRGVPGGQRADIFARIRTADATVFGSVSKQSQHMPGLVRSAADVDVAAAQPRALQRSLLGVSPEGARPAGTSIRGPRGHIFDIKAEPELGNFPYARRPIRAPGDTRITRLDEEMWRSVYGIRSRGGRAGWQGSKDINRFFSAARTLAESKRIQAERSTLFRGLRVSRAEARITEVEAFRLESPKIRERLRLRTDLPEAEFTGSYLPAGSSRLSSMLGRTSLSPTGPSSRTPRSGTPSAIPSGPPSLITGGFVPPSPGAPRGRGSMLPRPPPSVFTPPSAPPRTPDPFVPPSSPPPTEGPPPSKTPPLIPAGFMGRPRSRKSGRGRLSVKFGYAPSLTGLYLGGTIEKAPKISTGLGIRAPVRRKK